MILRELKKYTTYDAKIDRRLERVEVESMSSSTSDEVFQYTGRDTIPKDVTIINCDCNVIYIDAEAFYECTKLKEVVLNNGLQIIGRGAFKWCKSLESITLPSTVTHIGPSAFWGCENLREVVLNEGLKKIMMHAYYECRSLQRITLPSTVTDIGVEAFSNCDDLKEVVLNDGLKDIGEFAFSGSKSLQRITIPSSVTNIDDAVFAGCKKLEEVVLNEGLMTLGKALFGDCDSLRSITLPSTVIDIGARAFSGCTNLRAVVLNEGLVKIRNNAFDECNSLESITIPSSVIQIGTEAFNSCANLREVECSGVLPKLGKERFFGVATAFDVFSALERITFPNLSTRLDNIIQAGQVDIQEKVQQCINRSEMIEWRRGHTIYIPVEVMRSRDEWDTTSKQSLDQIISWIKYYEMKEATTLFELALWKAKIDQVDETTPFDRDACRVDVPGPVKDSILQCLNL